MNAGRKLDTLVAEKIMGLDVDVTDEECSMFTPGSHCVGGGEYYAVECHWSRPHIEDEDAPFDDILACYSTDIGAAWQVVEKMGGYCYLWRDGGVTPLIFDGQWECKLRREDEGRRYYAVAETAPLAICLAALKAIGVEL